MEKTIASVETYRPYDDTAIRAQVTAFEIELKSVKERQLQTAEAAVRIAEKASDAIALARETKALSSGAAAESFAATREARSLIESQSREIQTRLAALKQDLDSTAAALRAEMNVLKRATTNPLSNK